MTLHALLGSRGTTPSAFGAALARTLPLLLLAIVVLLRALAAASPTDPTWVDGVYDDGDFDDVVAQIALSTSACDTDASPFAPPDASVRRVALTGDTAPRETRRPPAQDRAPPLA
jgi:hypothetical protein